MPALARCWLLVSHFIIPPGYTVRWRLLSIFFNPLWLVVCQAFFWLRAAQKWVIMILIVPFRFASFLIFRAKVSVWPDDSANESQTSLGEDENNGYCYMDSMDQGIEWWNVLETISLTDEDEGTRVCRMIELVGACDDPAAAQPIRFLTDESVIPEEDRDRNVFENEDDGEYTPNDASIVEPEFRAVVNVSPEKDLLAGFRTVYDNLERDAFAEIRDLNFAPERDAFAEIRGFNVTPGRDALAEFRGLNFTPEINALAELRCLSFTPEIDALAGLETDDLHGGIEFTQEEREEDDGFYQEYTERMAGFDRGNFERSNELRAILTRIQGDSSFPLRFSTLVSTLLESSTGRTASTKKIIKSIQAEFETVYVGQSCLCWDALEFQYRAIQEVASSNLPERLHLHKLADDFQYFSTLLVRFMEDELAGGERFWNYAQSRLVSKSLLMVPSFAVCDYGRAEETRSGSIGPRKLLEIVEESIRTFHNFLTRDDKRTSRQPRRWLLWNVSQVEDANDIEFLSVVERTLRQKQESMANLGGEKRSGLLKKKRSFRVREPDRVAHLFSLIDLKLVTRVLNMSTVSGKQLHWCQHKLANIRLEGGRLERGFSANLFPAS